MKSFKDIIQEQEEFKKPAVIAFGRMNPPTTGHLKMIDKVRETAARLNAHHEVIASHSQDNKKNPLTAEQKIKLVIISNITVIFFIILDILLFKLKTTYFPI